MFPFRERWSLKG